MPGASESPLIATGATVVADTQLDPAALYFVSDNGLVNNNKEIRRRTDVVGTLRTTQVCSQTISARRTWLRPACFAVRRAVSAVWSSWSRVVPCWG